MHDVYTVYIPTHVTSVEAISLPEPKDELCSNCKLDAGNHSCMGKQVQSVAQPRHEWFL